MSTKKFKFGVVNGNNVKGGRNNTRSILTAAGIVAFGAAAAGGGYAAGSRGEPHLPDGQCLSGTASGRGTAAFRADSPV